MVDERTVAAGEKGQRVSLPRLIYASLGPPVLWITHFNLVYFLITMDCIGRWDGGVLSVYIATLLFLAADLLAGWIGWRDWRSLGGQGFSGDERGWAKFLLVIGMAGSLMFGAVIVLSGTSPLFVATCP